MKRDRTHTDSDEEGKTRNLRKMHENGESKDLKNGTNSSEKS